MKMETNGQKPQPDFIQDNMNIWLGLLIFIVYSFLQLTYSRGWWSKRVKHVNDVTDKVIIITGANSGAGIELSIKFAKLNAKTIILACRNEHRALAAIATIQKEVPNSKSNLEFIKIDLADLLSVKEFVRKV